MDPEGDFSHRRLALLDPQTALEGDHPRLIDEWQEAPLLWDAVRFQIDRGRQRGLYLLTGSTKPREHATAHSGTGRIVRRRMRPMSLVESGDSTGAASLRNLLDGGKLTPALSRMTLDDVLRVICRGGWPGSLDLDLPEAIVLARSYIDHLAESDISEVDDVSRNHYKVRAFLGSLARHTSVPVQIPTLRRDMSALETTATDATIRAYMDALRKLYVLEEIPAWGSHLRSREPLKATPKRLLADPSLAVASLGATPDRLKADLNTLGFLFESLCLRDLLVIGDAIDASVHHYRDGNGLEADAILNLPDNRWAGVEIKLGFNEVETAAASLTRLSKKVEGDGRPAPSALIVITGVGGLMETRSDGIHVVPIDQLGP
jgi:predicted AAA+ superfamily ATPase